MTSLEVMTFLWEMLLQVLQGTQVFLLPLFPICSINHYKVLVGPFGKKVSY